MLPVVLSLQSSLFPSGSSPQKKHQIERYERIRWFWWRVSFKWHRGDVHGGGSRGGRSWSCNGGDRGDAWRSRDGGDAGRSRHRGVRGRVETEETEDGFATEETEGGIAIERKKSPKEP
ncbi:hypothetical protein F2Q69_00008874 [Brassica cretica]|uniref:Uncharacterized protein n=1 Tax=Brassica cretica TaxID=69181 RepID=A0A8S9NYS7_BRACR|nr:hypothetical protein F2Q69_00008874 [Brassica cretica]